MAVTLEATKQQNIAVNRARHLIFFEGSEVCYNYKTGQWTSVPAYADTGVFSVNNKSVSVGLVRFSSGSVDLQEQSINMVPQTCTLTTGAIDINQGGRAIVNGVRPITNGGTRKVRIGVQDQVGDTVSWSSSQSINSRTNMANFRSEGRYIRMEVTLSDGFTTAMAADVDFAPQGRV